MKKGLIVFAALLIVALPAFAPAQGLSGFGLPGFPGVPGSAGGMYDPSARPFLTPPTFYIGWMESYRNATFSFNDTDLGGLLRLNARLPAAGIWLGLEEKINVSGNCGVAVDGWLLVPTNRRGATGDELQVVIDQGTNPPLVFNALERREWDTRNDWWYVDGMGYCGSSRTFTVLGGFRYEHFSARFTNPRDITAFVPVSDARVDITVNSYQPYVGVQYFLGGGSTGSINVRVLGFPYVPADVTFQASGQAGIGATLESKGNFKDSYFFEIFAQADRNIFGDANIGAFFRWNLLHGRTKLNSDLLPGIASGDNTGSFDRNTLTVGGSLSLNFVSPY